MISSGKTHSVRDFCKAAFEKVNLNYEDYIVQNPKFMRPEELTRLQGDNSKARKTLNWEPEFSFEDLVEDMVGLF